MKKLVVIGLDGFPYTFARRLIEEGVMPNFQALLEEGELFQMDSVYPTVSNVAWSSFQTGKNPGKFGIYGFAELDSDLGLYIPNSANLKAKTLWEIISENDGRLVSLGVPNSYPPRPVNGLLVGGFLSPSLEKAVYPASALSKLRETGYLVDINPMKARESLEAFKEENTRVFEGRVRTFFHLWDSEQWDLFVIHFMDTDRMGHFMFKYSEPEEAGTPNYEYFRRFIVGIDDMLRRVRSKLDGETGLIILSDHGFCRLRKEVQLNKWLEDKGYLSFSRPPAHDLDFEAISPQARAFSLVPGRVYILREGDWKNGGVKSSDYDNLRAEIMEALQELREDGRVVCKQVLRKEEVFSGPHLDRAPDILIDPVDGYDLKAGLKKDKIFSTGPISGMHTYSDALLYIRGGRTLPKRPVIWDLTPTILDLLSIPVPEDFDGVSLLTDP